MGNRSVVDGPATARAPLAAYRGRDSGDSRLARRIVELFLERRG